MDNLELVEWKDDQEGMGLLVRGDRKIIALEQGGDWEWKEISPIGEISEEAASLLCALQNKLESAEAMFVASRRDLERSRVNPADAVRRPETIPAESRKEVAHYKWASLQVSELEACLSKAEREAVLVALGGRDWMDAVLAASKDQAAP